MQNLLHQDSWACWVTPTVFPTQALGSTHLLCSSAAVLPAHWHTMAASCMQSRRQIFSLVKIQTHSELWSIHYSTVFYHLPWSKFKFGMEIFIFFFKYWPIKSVANQPSRHLSKFTNNPSFSSTTQFPHLCSHTVCSGAPDGHWSITTWWRFSTLWQLLCLWTSFHEENKSAMNTSVCQAKAFRHCYQQ